MQTLDTGSSGSSRSTDPSIHGWSGEYHKLRLRLYGLLFVSDACAMAIAFLGANAVRFGDLSAKYGTNSFGVLFPIYVAIGLNGGAWTVDALQSPRKSAVGAIRALAFSVAVASVIFFSLKIGEDFSRLVFGIGSGLALLLIATSRWFLGRLIGRAFNWTFRKQVLIVDGMEAVPLHNETVCLAAQEGLRPISDDPTTFHRLGKILDRCERVTLACPTDRREDWVRVLSGANVDVEVLAPELDILGALGLERHGSSSTLIVVRGPLRLRDRFLKRLLDVSVSVMALILMSPLLLTIATAIKLESPGPILFRQPRVGRGNRLFEVLKFRSMQANLADLEGVQSTTRRDERVTRVGRLLRLTSLDELPQLINVLRGEMSIVGPRPHAINSRVAGDDFWSIDGRYSDRHGIKPGMTGLAQIRGFRGATWERSDLTNRLQADLEYLDGWHIGRDLLIIARTFEVMIHPNAY